MRTWFEREYQGLILVGFESTRCTADLVRAAVGLRWCRVVEWQRLEVGSLRDGVATDLLWSWAGFFLVFHAGLSGLYPGYLQFKMAP